MITIRRVRCAAAAMGFVVGVSVVLILPQRILAQASVAGDAASSSGTAARAGIQTPSAPLTGSRLHVEPGSEAATVPQSGLGAVSQPWPAIHVEMAQTARNSRKPVESSPLAAMAFKPAGSKPVPETEDVAAQELTAEQAAKPSELPETVPAPAVAEPVSSQKKMSARLPSQPAGEATLQGATEGNAIEGNLSENEANRGNQQAALPPASAPAGPSAIAQLAFAPETATLSTEAKAMLKGLAARFPAHDENVRLQLMAYASAEGMSASKARRLSLARALSVREYLIANGIDSTRMDVRALGDENARLPGGSPANRVDIAMIRR